LHSNFLTNIEIILISCAGSFISYFIVVISPTPKQKSKNAIEVRLKAWQNLIKHDPRLILWDIFIIVGVFGLCYTFFIMEPTTKKQAFFSGLTAEGFFVHYLNSARNKIFNQT
jgi:hypothetical protein